MNVLNGWKYGWSAVLQLGNLSQYRIWDSHDMIRAEFRGIDDVAGHLVAVMQENEGLRVQMIEASKRADAREAEAECHALAEAEARDVARVLFRLVSPNAPHAAADARPRATEASVQPINLFGHSRDLAAD